MLKAIGTVGKFIKIAVKYYSVIIVVAKAYDMIAEEVRKIHQEKLEENAN